RSCRQQVSLRTRSIARCPVAARSARSAGPYPRRLQRPSSRLIANNGPCSALGKAALLSRAGTAFSRKQLCNHLILLLPSTILRVFAVNAYPFDGATAKTGSADGSAARLLQREL